MKMTFDVKGLKDLEKTLMALPQSVSQNTARAAMRQAAKPMAERARSLARERTGRLKKSIRIGTRLNGRQVKILSQLSPEQRSAIELYLGPSYAKGDKGRHGHLVEFGTRPRKNGGKFKGTQHPGTPPRPFMRPAFDAEAEATINRIGPILFKVIQRAVKREAKKAGR